MKKLYQRLWFYKEYILIIILGISTVLWLMSSLSKPVEGFLGTKKETISEKKSVTKDIVLPSNEALISSVVNDEIQKEDFIKQYKNMLKAQNNLKGKVLLKFTFYQKDSQISSAEIMIRWEDKEKNEMIIKKHIVRISKENSNTK